jgi:outer membrane protein OmpA-like peptidoglycan-associated protein
MRRTRTGLFLATAACLLLSAGAFAQTAPTLSGTTGLFETPNAETLPPGRFSIGASGSLWALTAAPSLGYGPLPHDPLRYQLGRFGLTVAYGLLPNFEAWVNFGSLRYKADSLSWSGNINGRDTYGGFDTVETDKFRIGAKWVMNPRDPVRVAAFLNVAFPTGGGTGDPNSFSTGRTDWGFGASFNYEWFTLGTVYALKSDFGTPGAYYGTTLVGAAVPNEWTWSAGGNVSIIPGILRGIAELNRHFFYGGESNPRAYSEALLGARVALGRDSGLAFTGAARVNIDEWSHYGSSPSPFGGVILVAWMPQPPAPPRPVVQAAQPEATPTAPVPPPAPAAVSAAAPAPAEASTGAAAPMAATTPAVKPVTTTTDEILYDTTKSRLTNIAKAILDGVALRLKNNLAASCTITGYADPSEKGDRSALAKGRADAAKDYLVKRHGIDAGRITVAAGGTASTPDATRNRRAVVTVTFP